MASRKFLASGNPLLATWLVIAQAKIRRRILAAIQRVFATQRPCRRCAAPWRRRISHDEYSLRISSSAASKSAVVVAGRKHIMEEAIATIAMFERYAFNKIRFNELLIGEVKKYELLYNAAHAEYKNVQKKDKIWLKIAKTCDAPVDECRKRWRGLRDTYRRKLNAAPRSNSSKKKWVHSDHMTFMDPLITVREPLRRDAMDFMPDEDSISNSNLFESTDCFTAAASSSFLNNDLSNGSERKKPSRKEAEADTKPILKKSPEETRVRTRKEVTAISATSAERNATFMLFESLAKKITDAQLPRAALYRIEHKVTNVVFEELTKIDIEENS